MPLSRGFRRASCDPPHAAIRHFHRTGGHDTPTGNETVNLIKITDVTGHRSLEMLKTYSRDAQAFVGHAGAGLL